MANDRGFGVSGARCRHARLAAYYGAYALWANAAGQIQSYGDDQVTLGLCRAIAVHRDRQPPVRDQDPDRAGQKLGSSSFRPSTESRFANADGARPHMARTGLTVL